MRSQDVTKDLEAQQRIMDVLAKASTMAGGVSAEELMRGFFGKSGLGSGSVGASIFRNAHIDIEMATAALAAMGQQGIKGSEAGTVLSRMLLTLEQSAVRNRDAWKALGIQVY